MRVLCVDASDDKGGYESENGFKLKEGEYYEAIREVIGVGKDGSNVLSYELLEDPGWAFAQWHFAPTSNINEKAFERNYKTEKINQ